MNVRIMLNSGLCMQLPFDVGDLVQRAGHHVRSAGWNYRPVLQQNGVYRPRNPTLMQTYMKYSAATRNLY
jgi:hypothetical protein